MLQHATVCLKLLVGWWWGGWLGRGVGHLFKTAMHQNPMPYSSPQSPAKIQRNGNDSQLRLLVLPLGTFLLLVHFVDMWIAKWRNVALFT